MAKDFTTITKFFKDGRRVDMSDKWKEISDKSEKMHSLSIEISEMLDKIGPKYKEIESLIEDAYKSAPLVDCSLSVSPFGQSKMMAALKNHLRKRGLELGGNFIGDSEKLSDFSEHIKYANKWLLKFSTMNGG